MIDTVDKFLKGSIHVLGGIRREKREIDLFDLLLLENFSSSLHDDFSKVIDKYSEINDMHADFSKSVPYQKNSEHNVHV